MLFFFMDGVRSLKAILNFLFWAEKHHADSHAKQITSLPPEFLHM